MVGEEVVQDVGQAADRSLCVSPEHSLPSVVRHELSSSYCTRYPATAVDRAISVCFFPLSTLGQDLDENKGGQGRGSDNHSPHVAEVVHPFASVGM